MFELGDETFSSDGDIAPMVKVVVYQQLITCLKGIERFQLHPVYSCKNVAG